MRYGFFTLWYGTDQYDTIRSQLEINDTTPVNSSFIYMTK
jgi:hypothetical protein